MVMESGAGAAGGEELALRPPHVPAGLRAYVRRQLLRWTRSGLSMAALALLLVEQLHRGLEHSKLM
jgi:hypothetical protein